MSDADEIEQLLGKAQKQIARRGWLKTALVCVSTLVGTCVGASKSAVAVGELIRQIATKDDVAKIAAGQQQQIDSLRSDHTHLANRVTATEAVASNARDAVSKESKRVDALYAMPLRVRNQ